MHDLRSAARSRTRARPSPRRGFSLAEALLALTLTSLASTALLLSAYTSLSTSDEVVEQAIARGVAEQVIDEVLGACYAEKGTGPYQTSLGPNAWELAGKGRERFSDTDDFHAFRRQPIEDRFGSPLGQGDGAGSLRPAAFRVRSGYFSRWRLEIDVYYVSAANPSQKLAAGQTSALRAVEVRVLRTNENNHLIPLASARRVFAYVPLSDL